MQNTDLHHEYIEKLRLIGSWNYSTALLPFHAKFLLLIIIFFAIKFFSKSFMVTTTDQRGEVFAIKILESAVNLEP